MFACMHIASMVPYFDAGVLNLNFDADLREEQPMPWIFVLSFFLLGEN